MPIKFLPSLFFSLLFFCNYVFIISVAVNPGDYVFVDPKNAKIKVKDLRALLDQRGMPYHDFNEKSEYVNALIESGPLTVGELKIARDPRSASISSDDIKELVTDSLSKKFFKTAFSNSEIWLVRIDPAINPMTNILEEAVWHRLKSALSTFEVQFGRYNCEDAAEYCEEKGWNSPTLILIVPQLYNSAQPSAKAVADLLQTNKNSDDQWVYEVDSVVKQIYSQVHGELVRYLPSREDFDNFQADKLKCAVHMVLLTDLRHCPFLLSALAAKFNHGSHCFAFGPKMIASGSVPLPYNHVGAFYAIKSQHYYSNRWRIIPRNQSKPDANDDTSNAMVTFDSLSDLLMQLSLMKAEKPKTPKREPVKKETPKREQPKRETPKNKPLEKESPKKESPKKEQPKKEPPKEAKKPPPAYTSRRERSGFGADLIAILTVFGVELLVFISFIMFLYYVCFGEAKNGREEELARYRSNISSRDRSDQQNFRSDTREEEEENRNGQSFTQLSATLYSSTISSDREFTLRTPQDIMTVFTLRFTHLTAWYKQVFIRYNFSYAVSEQMRRQLARYNIRIEEIGFPPYNWILRLPTVEVSRLSEDIRQSLCPICQYSINNAEDSLCRLPCDCTHIVYHFDCIIPWLIKREDPSSHSFSSGTLHTERPCPTCRFDITTWGLRTAS